MKDMAWVLLPQLVAITFLTSWMREDARRHAREAREDARMVARACRERGGR